MVRDAGGRYLCKEMAHPRETWTPSFGKSVNACKDHYSAGTARSYKPDVSERLKRSATSRKSALDPAAFYWPDVASAVR
jgi:hypothetical protein